MKMKERWKDLFIAFIPLLWCIPIALGTVLLASPVAVIFYNMDVLGIFWTPALLAYALFLSVLVRQINRRKEYREERQMYGDELFFEAYPHMKRAEERRLRFKAWLDRRLVSRKSKPEMKSDK